MPDNSEQHERLGLFASILVRLEWRLGHDSRAIRTALDLPVVTLRGAAPAALLGGSVEDLHALRRAVDTFEAPKVKWFRVGH